MQTRIAFSVLHTMHIFKHMLGCQLNKFQSDSSAYPICSLWNRWYFILLSSMWVMTAICSLHLNWKSEIFFDGLYALIPAWCYKCFSWPYYSYHCVRYSIYFRITIAWQWYQCLRYTETTQRQHRFKALGRSAQVMQGYEVMSKPASRAHVGALKKNTVDKTHVTYHKLIKAYTEGDESIH